MHAVRIFEVCFYLGAGAWFIGVGSFVMARRHYIGPRGIAALINPLAAWRAVNYTSAGPAHLRRSIACFAIFVAAGLIGLAIGFVGVAHRAG
jgi:hypothetical protein